MHPADCPLVPQLDFDDDDDEDDEEDEKDDVDGNEQVTTLPVSTQSAVLCLLMFPSLSQESDNISDTLTQFADSISNSSFLGSVVLEQKRS